MEEKKLASKALIYKKKRVLFLQRTKDNKWHLPGGGAERKENPVQTLKREVKEETTFQIKRNKLISTIETDDEIMSIFIADVVGNLKLSREHRRFMWISLRDASRLDMTSNAKTIVKDLSRKGYVR